jgi:hypothetical protein
MVPIFTPNSDPDNLFHNGTIRTHAQNGARAETAKLDSILFKRSFYARANKTNINQNSVVFMIRRAKQTRSLYEDMQAAGYTDEEFPNWWHKSFKRQDKFFSVQGSSFKRQDKFFSVQGSSCKF